MESNLLRIVVSISVGMLVAAIMLPVALVTTANANLTGVDESVAIVVQILLPTLAAIGIALAFLRET